ncbi:DUF4153 domain-containing protein [Shimia thalassica]|uniref:DUF4153 domain-containing protein n=1 Tax=Shimia thalassica TaxID=1715693 RepID=UPI0027336193|nr:DUF4153 domain-containing protein [Shimia thalassica]MDP2579382.1 DUF4153 domain-containing protein [Shimia thalassica]
MTTQDAQVTSGRATMAVVGGMTGLAIWAMFDILPDILTNPHLFATVLAMGCGFVAVMLAIVGPVQIPRAAMGAAALSIPAAVMLGWGSLRFETAETLWEDSLLIQAWGLFLFIGTPFAAAYVSDKTYWRKYEKLFDYSWAIVVRYTAAWMFVGAFWLLVFLSNALLNIVGISAIETILDYDPVPYVLTGAVLGVALMVGYEMRDYLSAYLVLHLLRLLTPAMLAVVVIFVGALPFQDPNALFGGLSPAGTLLAVVAGAVSLISVSIDKNESEAVSNRLMRLSTEGLALLLPVLAGLIVYSVWLRVAQHGWTPARLASAVLALFAVAYGVFYVLAVLRRKQWMARIRKANMVIALAMMVACLIWMSPVLDAQRIATNSQVSRYLEGKSRPQDVPIWEMVHEWGLAGAAGAAQLRALEGEEHAELREAVGFAGSTGKRYIFERKSEDVLREDRVGRLVEVITLVAEGVELDRELLTNLPDFRLQDWLVSCEREHDPGCVLVLGEFDPASEGQEGMIFLPGSGEGYEAVSVAVRFGALEAAGPIRDGTTGAPVRLSQDQVNQVLAGDFRLAPSRRKALWLGDVELLPQN